MMPVCNDVTAVHGESVTDDKERQNLMVRQAHAWVCGASGWAQGCLGLRGSHVMVAVGIDVALVCGEGAARCQGAADFFGEKWCVHGARALGGGREIVSIQPSWPRHIMPNTSDLQVQGGLGVQTEYLVHQHAHTWLCCTTVLPAVQAEQDTHSG